MIAKIHRKAKLLKLLDPFETSIINKETKKYKKDYVGQNGYLIKQMFFSSAGHNETLYDMEFEDGQVWCVEKKQIKILKEK